MKLPICDIRYDGLSNLNPEGSKISVIGTGYIEENYEDVMKDYKTFLARGNVGYKTDIDFSDDMTLEFVAVDELHRGIYFSTGRSGVANTNFIAVELNNTYFTIRRYYTDTQSTTRTNNVIVTHFDELVGARSFQVIKREGILTFYVDGVLLDYSWTIEDGYREGVLTLLNVADSNDDVTTAISANFEAIRVNPNHTLEPFMFFKSSIGLSRDEELSFVPTTTPEADDLVTKFVESISNYKDYVVVRYTDDSLESFARPQGKDVANYIKNIYKTADLDMFIVLDDDSEISVGKSPATKETVYGSQIEGTGYKSGTEMIPFDVTGNLYTIVDGMVSSPKLTQIALNYQLRISYTSYMSQTDVTPSNLEKTSDGWYIYPTVATYTEKAPIDTSMGTVTLTTGEYYADGFIVLRPSDSTVIGLLDDDDRVMLTSGNIGTGNQGTTGNHNVKLQGKFLVLKPTVLRIAMRTTTVSPYGPVLDSLGRVTNLNIFKVA